MVSKFLSPSMFVEKTDLSIKKISIEDTKRIWAEAQNKRSAVGHKSTAELLNALDFQIEAQRIEEGQIYSLEELSRFLQEGKINFYFILVKEKREGGEKC